jgi:hypothetical protein
MHSCFRSLAFLFLVITIFCIFYTNIVAIRPFNLFCVILTAIYASFNYWYLDLKDAFGFQQISYYNPTLIFTKCFLSLLFIGSDSGGIVMIYI